jgi:hypothetical protein
MRVLKKVKHFYQRAARGYSDEDVWDFDTYLSSMMPGALRQLKKGYGCPSEFYDDKNRNLECEKWHVALEEMALGFEAAAFIKNCGYRKWVEREDGFVSIETDTDALINAKKKMEKGLSLFAKYYLDLWD